MKIQSTPSIHVILQVDWGDQEESTSSFCLLLVSSSWALDHFQELNTWLMTLYNPLNAFGLEGHRWYSTHSLVLSHLSIRKISVLPKAIFVLAEYTWKLPSTCLHES